MSRPVRLISRSSSHAAATDWQPDVRATMALVRRVGRHARQKAFLGGFTGVLLLAAVLRLAALEDVGYGNPYYAAAVRSMLQSWGNFFFVSYDPVGFVAVDKPPLGLWIQAASAWIFGYHRLSLLLPQVLAGLLSVAIVALLVRHAFGGPAGLFAALVAATMPISVVTDRTNELDSVLVLVLLLAVGAYLRAASSGCVQDALLAGAVLGVGFNVKMLAAVIPLPALSLYYLLTARGSLAHRIGRLCLAVAALVAVGAIWPLAVQLTPPNLRPYVGSSADNSVWNLIVGHNGMTRLFPGGLGSAGAQAAPPWNIPAGGPLTAPPPGPPTLLQEIGPPSALRLFNAQLSGQASWLLPVVPFGLLAARQGLLKGHGFSLAGAHTLLWLVWLLTAVAFFSVANLFHRYYLGLLMPPVAALVGSGVVALWRGYRGNGLDRWLLISTIATTAGAQVAILAYWPDWQARLLPGIVGAAALAITVLILARVCDEHGRSWLKGAAGAVGGGGLLLAPIVWNLISITEPLPMRTTLPFAGPSAPAGPAPAQPPDRTGGFNRPDGSPLLNYLREHRGGADVLLATPNAMLASPLIIASGEPVIAVGGFSGNDRIVTEYELRRWVDTGSLRFFLLPRDSGRGPSDRLGGRRPSTQLAWVSQQCQPVPPERWSAPAAGRARPTPPPGAGAPRPLGGLQLMDCAPS